LDYKRLLAPIVSGLLETLLNTTDFSMDYAPGWNTQNTLKEVLARNFSRDQQLGYTQQGPHRSDLQLKIQNIPAHEVLSQGQQKLAAYALRLAQGILLKKQTSKDCIFLIDDLPSELDGYKRGLISELIRKLNTQVIVTGIDQDSLGDLLDVNTQVFHVEHGSFLPQCKTE
jgi:DNA replication and repair protein RecF